MRMLEYKKVNMISSWAIISKGHQTWHWNDFLVPVPIERKIWLIKSGGTKKHVDTIGTKCSYLEIDAIILRSDRGKQKLNSETKSICVQWAIYLFMFLSFNPIESTNIKHIFSSLPLICALNSKSYWPWTKPRKCILKLTLCLCVYVILYWF